MNDKLLNKCRIALEQILAELAEQDTLGTGAQATVALDQQSVGRLSRMDALQHQAMALANQTQRNMAKIRAEAALKRIDEGEFGYCTDCGEDIPAERLALNPAAPRCVSCVSG